MFGDRNDYWTQQCILRIKVIYVMVEPVQPIVKAYHGCPEYLNGWYPYLYADNVKNAE